MPQQVRHANSCLVKLLPIVGIVAAPLFSHHVLHAIPGFEIIRSGFGSPEKSLVDLWTYGSDLTVAVILAVAIFVHRARANANGWALPKVLLTLLLLALGLGIAYAVIQDAVVRHYTVGYGKKKKQYLLLVPLPIAGWATPDDIKKLQLVTRCEIRSGTNDSPSRTRACDAGDVAAVESKYGEKTIEIEHNVRWRLWAFLLFATYVLMIASVTLVFGITVLNGADVFDLLKLKFKNGD